MIEVSGGIIYNPEGRILVCQRSEGRRNALLWEFPGGKNEPGEDPVACVQRELLEELQLPVTDVKLAESREFNGMLFHFLTARTDAQPVMLEHNDMKFVTPRELLQVNFCPADLPTGRRFALRPIRHVFWDFDGTLMDSYPAMVQAFVAGAADFGVSVTPERTLSLMKDCLQHCCEVIGRESGVPADALREAFRRHEADELPGLPPMPGVPEALQAMHRAGVKHYVATHRDLVCRELLEKAGLLPYFSGFVTREDGHPRKPAPDMLLHLMRSRGLSPEECMMVGDRPLDTESGLNAGITSVLIDPEGRFPGAACDLTVRSARELADLMS